MVLACSTVSLNISIILLMLGGIVRGVVLKWMWRLRRWLLILRYRVSICDGWWNVYLLVDLTVKMLLVLKLLWYGSDDNVKVEVKTRCLRR